MEEIYKNKQIIVKLTKEEIMRMLARDFISGFKIKQIGMVANE